MYVLWEGLDPRAGIFFVLFLICSEIFVQARWRLSVICQSCGFDPILYKKNQNQAAQNVKIFLAEKKKNPENLLRKPLNLPVLKVNTNSEKPKYVRPKSSLLSRQV